MIVERPLEWASKHGYTLKYKGRTIKEVDQSRSSYEVRVGRAWVGSLNNVKHHWVFVPAPTKKDLEVLDNLGTDSSEVFPWL